MMKGIVSLAAGALALASSFAQTPAPKPAAASPDARQLQERQLQERRIQTPAGVPASSLTAEERAKLQEASGRLQKEQSAAYLKMSQIRREIEELGRAETLDEDAIRAKAMELGKIEGDLAILRARHFKEVRGILPQGRFEHLQQGTQARPDFQQRLQSVVARTNSAPATNRPARPPGSAPVRK